MVPTVHPGNFDGFWRKFEIQEIPYVGWSRKMSYEKAPKNKNWVKL